MGKEKAKKEKMENDKKLRIENQRKAEAKKQRKERERELKIADEEQQKILKEKWYQQEREKSDKKPKTIKEFKKLNDIPNPEEKDDFDTLKKKQNFEHQQVLKQRWVEYEDDKKFYKNAKKQEGASKKKEETQNLTRDEVIEVSKDEKVIETNVISSIEPQKVKPIIPEANDTSMEVRDELDDMTEETIEKDNEIQLTPQEKTPEPPVSEAIQKTLESETVSVREETMDTVDNKMDIQEREKQKIIQKQNE